MTMELVTKAVIVGAAGTILTLVIKRTNPEISAALTLAVCALVLTLAMETAAGVLRVLEIVEADTGFSASYTAPVLKCVGIGIVSKLGADVCRDGGQTAVAASLEICGAICAVYVALPLIKTLLQMMGELV